MWRARRRFIAESASSSLAIYSSGRRSRDAVSAGTGILLKTVWIWTFRSPSRRGSSEPDWSAYELDMAVVADTTGTSRTRALDSTAFRRHVALRPLRDGTTQLGLLVSAVVSWPEGGRWRQVVLHTMVYDPAGNNAPVPGL